jgi:hypothetical protein
MTRTRIGLVVSALALALVGLTACGRTGTDSAAAPAGATEQSVEVQALQAIGFNSADLAAAPADLAAVPAAEPSGSPGPKRPDGEKRPDGDRPGPMRGILHKGVLHGEATLTMKDGTVRVVAVQRGTVTAIDDKSITVKSSDGFEQKWTFGSPMHVVEHRTAIAPSAIKVGSEVGVAGAKKDGTLTARLIVVPAKK